MIVHTIDRLIRLPRHTVFALLERPEAIPVWNPAIESARPLTDGNVRKGSRFLLRRADPRPAIEEAEVIEHEPNRRYALQGDFGPFVGALEYRLEEAPEGTRLHHVAYLEPKGPTRLITPLAARRVRAAVADDLDRLGRVLERTARARRMATQAIPPRHPSAARS
jgi:uncharacterized protein YndB with AHSA1/START domain